MRLVWRFWCFSLLMLCHFCSKHDLCHWSVCYFYVEISYDLEWYRALALSLPLFLIFRSCCRFIMIFFFSYSAVSFVFSTFSYNCYARFPGSITFSFFSPLKIRFCCYNNHWIKYVIYGFSIQTKIKPLPINHENTVPAHIQYTARTLGCSISRKCNRFRSSIRPSQFTIVMPIVENHQCNDKLFSGQWHFGWLPCTYISCKCIPSLAHYNIVCER